MFKNIENGELFYVMNVLKIDIFDNKSTIEKPESDLH